MFKPLAKILVPGAKVFKKAKEGDAGYDIWALNTMVVPSQGHAIFKTGIATAYDPDWVGLVMDRSGWGWKGLMRQAGVIDSGYRGEWLVKLYNTSNAPMELEGVLDNPDAKAICQAVFVMCADGEFTVVDVLPTSVRGVSGFGSSDK
jgi:dUTP pyrophosphatase